MPLCENRFPLPGQPSTCVLDTALVPLPAFLLYAALVPYLIITHSKPRVQRVLPKAAFAVYMFIIFATFAMHVIEIVRMILAHLGVGLMPMDLAGLLLVVILIATRKPGLEFLVIPYWLLLVPFLGLKTSRLVQLLHLNPMTGTKYPASDWATDVAVQCGLYVVLLGYDVAETLLARKKGRQTLVNEDVHALEKQNASETQDATA